MGHEQAHNFTMRSLVGVLVGVPLIFAAAIFLSVVAFFVFLFIYGWPAGV